MNWKRPDIPTTVGLQVGHWKTEEAPEEQVRLRDNTGASGGGKSEWEVNMAIVREMQKILEDRRVEVDIHPTTIPPGYFADAFISIHADGNTDPNKSGYKLATSWRDVSGKSNNLLELIDKSYGEITGLEVDPNVTRNMRGYYAFRWWRYEHSIHPMTPAIILETGFLSSPSDRQIIVNQPELVAEAATKGLIEFLSSEELLDI